MMWILAGRNRLLISEGWQRGATLKAAELGLMQQAGIIYRRITQAHTLLISPSGFTKTHTGTS